MTIPLAPLANKEKTTRFDPTVTKSGALGRNGEGDRNSANVDSSSITKSGTTTSLSANGNTTSGKRAKNKKRREAQQEFAHPWMVGALKGHTGPILDISFSSNGKFLASCAEDCDLVPEEEPEFGDASSSSGEGDYVLEEKSRRQGNTVGSGSSSRTTGSVVVTNSNGRNSSQSSRNSNEPLISTSSPSVKQLQKVRSSLSSSSSSSSSLSQVPSEGVTAVTADRTSLSRRQRKNRTRAPREQQQRARDRDEDADELVTASKPRHRHHHRIHHQPDVKLRHCRDESPVRTDNSSKCNSSKARRSKSPRSPRKSSENPEATMNINRHPLKSSFNPSNVQIPRTRYQHSNVNMIVRTIPRNYFVYVNNGIACNDLLSTRNRFDRLSESAFVCLMKRYVLPKSLCITYGYPIQFENLLDCVFIKHYQPSTIEANVRWYRHLDVNAREFVPSNKNSGKCSATNDPERVWTAAPAESEIDSGTGSGSSVENSDQEPECSSDTDKNSDVGESFPLSSSSSSSSSLSSGYSEDLRRDSTAEISEAPFPPAVMEHECTRCGKYYSESCETREYTMEEKCVYHWGKLLNSQVPGVKPRTWECCQNTENVGGCTTASKHVWSGLLPGYNGPFYDYVRTRPSQVFAADGNYGVYAIDCEMCFTRLGLELTKVTVVSLTGAVVYDTLVKPRDKIIDYNTRFSGITAEIMAQATKTLPDVQRDILSFIHAETVLVGHGLGNDLRALKIVHGNVIDTTVIYPHVRGFPIRRSLKAIARSVLGREIQVSKHDSVEDARTAMEITIAKLWSDIF
ncbi:uncharacterized protein [Venturia canescens]|uniref:uncharacterized protein isoform X2 n=1 Tax=Venturia canescens TaxID=32260 RepID=UPI001C9CF695|nr:uncharacterized protein LOC122406813 isoform X2 [Venturia canescens]